MSAVIVPPARGRRGFTRERRTFAVLVAGVDRSRPGAAAILGERVRGRIEAPEGVLVLVYGEDRAPLDGRLLFHCLDLYRVERGRLARLDTGTLTDPWLPPVLDSIERAQAGVYDDDQAGDDAQEVVPLTLPHGRHLSRGVRAARLGALAAFLAIALGSTGAPAPASADVRSTASWHDELAPREWARLPASVCHGRLPSDYEAWSVRTGGRVGDGRLFHGTSPARIVGSSYRRRVRAFVWCGEGPATRTTGSMRDVLAIRRGAIRRGRVLAIRRGHVLPIRRGRVLALPPHGGNRPPWPMLRIIDAAVGKRP